MNRAQLFGLIAVVSMLSACGNKQQSAPCTDCQDGTGGVAIGLWLTSADVVHVTATVTGAGITTPITSDLAIGGSPTSASGTISNIPAGAARTITINAYPADPEAAVVIFRGQTTVAIEAGQLATAALTLFPVDGDLGVTATFPAGDMDISRIHHISVVTSGNRIDTPATFYLVPNIPSGTAAGSALRIPVGLTRTALVKSFTSDGTLLHQGTADAAVAETGSTVQVTMTNATGQGGVGIDAGFCTPNCGSAVCGDDGCGGSCGGCMPGAVCASGACLFQFDVSSATPTSQTALQVVFSAPPTAAQANDPAQYCISDGTPASCISSLAVTAASLSGSTVTLTTALQTPSAQYTVFVANVTRGADGAALVTASAPFIGHAAPPPFVVQGAAATSLTTIEVTYSDAYVTGAAAEDPTSYCVVTPPATDCTTPALAISGAAISAANKIVLTTATQASNGSYRVLVTGDVRRASNNDALTTKSFDLGGFNLITNGSFEGPVGTSIAGWTMVGSTGPLTAILGSGVSISPHDGVNIVRFASLATTVGGREAHSTCFALKTAGSPPPIVMTGWVRTPPPTVTGNPQTSLRIYWFTDAACTVANTTTQFTTQSPQLTLSTSDVWVQNTFTKSGPFPTGSLSAYVSIRANSGASGNNGDPLYFDDIAVTQ